MGEKKIRHYLLILAVLLLGVLAIVLVVSFFPQQPDSSDKLETTVVVRELSLAEFKEVYDKRDLAVDRFMILDLRARGEWEEAFIPGSISFESGRLDEQDTWQKLDTYNEVAVVADDLGAASLFVDQLKIQSWVADKRIYLLEDPVSGWFAAGYSKSRFLLAF
ncbi:rhodanese-like domain-containing protein [Patescibacteria group bacterium]|nr:rhodanese-like domain-containing protein [Patescibacteria group bacterium]MBU1868782.1 rhodanese-like domain-containing protein [Patescibacteria group bacterium]